MTHDFKTVGCMFSGSGKLYTYKTRLDLVKGDKVVVDVNGEFKVVEVGAVHSTPQIDPKAAKGFYKWIVSKVDLEHYAAEKASDTKKLVPTKTIRYEA